MKSLALIAVLAFAGCVKQGQVRDERPAPALRDLCTDARFKSICTPVQMPTEGVRVDTNLMTPPPEVHFS
jgi:hypothetical protein